MSLPVVEFYTRPGCHLCHDALEVLEGLKRDLAFEIRVVDISGSAGLSQLYGNDIPVATLEGRKILKHRADPGKLREILIGRGVGLKGDAGSAPPPP